MAYSSVDTVLVSQDSSNLISIFAIALVHDADEIIFCIGFVCFHLQNENNDTWLAW